MGCPQGSIVKGATKMGTFAVVAVVVVVVWDAAECVCMYINSTSRVQSATC